MKTFPTLLVLVGFLLSAALFAGCATGAKSAVETAPPASTESRAPAVKEEPRAAVPDPGLSRREAESSRTTAPAVPLPRQPQARPEPEKTPSADKAPAGKAEPDRAAPAETPARTRTSAPSAPRSAEAARIPAPEKSAEAKQPAAAASPGTAAARAQTAPAASAEPAPAAPRTAPAGSARTLPAESPAIAAEIGRPVTVSLPGIGWIFLGEEGNTGKIRYQGKEAADGNTVFSFLAYEKGDYDLKFQQQDLASGTIRYEGLRIAVLPGKPDAASSPAAEEVAAPAKAPAAEGVKAAPAPQEAGGGEKPESPAPAETEEEKYRRLLGEGRLKEAVLEIEGFLQSRGEDFANLDEWYFKLAELYEKDRDLKNMKKALWYYERVRDLFPLSSYWEGAERRSRYIRVNFFEIR